MMIQSAADEHRVIPKNVLEAPDKFLFTRIDKKGPTWREIERGDMRVELKLCLNVSGS